MVDNRLANSFKTLIKMATPSLPIEELVEKLSSGGYHNVIVMNGAGISTAAGIPDFRSPKVGLYASLKEMGHWNFRSPTFVFDIDVFKSDPRPFWWIFCHLWPRSDWPQPTNYHYLCKLLHEKGMLLRCYTQNIDALEESAGVPHDKVVYAHGVLNPCHCLDCGAEYPLSYCLEAIKPNINNPEAKNSYEKVVIPECTHCHQNHIKPDVVFFGEDLPSRFYELYHVDFPKCDLLIIAGTSLEVYPFASLVDKVNPEVPRFMINRDKIHAKGPLTDVGNWLKSAVTFFSYNFSGNLFDYGAGRDFWIGGDIEQDALDIIHGLDWDNDLQTLKTIDSVSPLEDAAGIKTNLTSVSDETPQKTNNEE